MRSHQVGSYVRPVKDADHPAIPPDPSVGSASTAGPDYEIRIGGLLGTRWISWFDGMDVVASADGTTAIRGSVADQAALHGLLDRLRDLGVELISVAQLSSDLRPPACTPLTDSPRQHPSDTTGEPS